MSNRKIYTIFLTLEDRIDVDLEFEKGRGKAPRLARFAITYSARLGGRWREVVRYDNFHGFLHRQRFWRSGRPEALTEGEPVPPDQLLAKCQADLRQHWSRYRRLMEGQSRED